MRSAQDCQVNHILLGSLTKSMNKFSQKWVRNGFLDVNSSGCRTDLGFPRAARVVNRQELIPSEKDPVLSIAWKASSGILEGG